MVWFFDLISFYYFFYLILIVGSLQVVVLNNPIYSVLHLIIVFMSSSFLLIVFGFHFLGLIIMIVYLGAVVVLFLFIVMLLNIKILELRRGVNFYPFLSICFINFLILYLFIKFEFSSFTISSNFFFNTLLIDWSFFLFEQGSFKIISKLLYTFHFFHFILASTILFTAMIGAIVLTLLQTRSLRIQNYFNQVIRSRGTILINGLKGMLE